MKIKSLKQIIILATTLVATSFFAAFVFLAVPAFAMEPADEEETTEESSSEEEADLSEYSNISFLGDSITYGLRSEKAYEYFLGELMGAETVNNYGICSSQISTGGTGDDSTAFVNRYTEIDEDSDLIFIFGGTNDWSHCTELGELGDTDTDTFYGALDTLISSLLEEYPDATLVIATPLHRIDERSGFYYNEDGEYVNTNGDSLEDFANAIIEVAKKYGITVVDLYNMESCDFSSDTEYEIFDTASDANYDL